MRWKYLLLACVPLLMLVDQLSKWWVIEMTLRPQIFEAQGASAAFWPWLTTLGQEQFPRAVIPLCPSLNIAMAWNKGVSFSLFTSSAAIMPYILSIFAILMVIGLLVWFKRTPHIITAVPLVMIISGALSNVWDRVRFGAVADFIDFYVGDWHYATFNVADCCIVIGVAGLALDGLVLEPRRLKMQT